MSSHATCPYRAIPDAQRWDRAFAPAKRAVLDPYEGQTPRFGFDRQARIVTAGSCFAQNIARRLRHYGYGYVMAEYDAALSPAENDARNNTMFSARTGNVYTVAHLAQLLDRAAGAWTPHEEYWEVDGRFFDPYRPSVDPKGFATLAELRAARAAHLYALHDALKTCDVFIFTLGLTEGWVNKADGAAYPICPGCGFGAFDAEKYAFKNYSLAEINFELQRALKMLRALNPRIKVILTLSPVPLAATMEPHHVLLSTVESKSALRMACKDAVAAFPNVDYFASYEIVNWGRDMSSYFEGDLRTVSEDGINHVMRVFFRHYAGHILEDAPAPGQKAWCDDDLLLSGTLNAPIKTAPKTVKAGQSQMTPDQVYAQELELRKKDFFAKKFEVTAQRHPHPFTTWKGLPGQKVLFGRTLDDHGYYNSRAIAGFMGPEFRRVCVIGPSIIMDLENEEPDTICGQLQRELNGQGYDHVFVYNCGINASNSSQDVSNLVHYVTDFQPDVLIVASGGNDMRGHISGDPRPGYPQSFFLWEKILASFRVTGVPPDVTAYLEDFEYNLTALRESEGAFSPAWMRAISENYENHIFRIRAMAKGFDFGCLVLNAPTRGSHRLTREYAEAKRDAFLRDQVRRADFFNNELTVLCAADDFFARNMAASMDDLDPAALYTDDIHMVPSGYERIAKQLAADLIAQFPTRMAKP